MKPIRYLPLAVVAVAVTAAASAGLALGQTNSDTPISVTAVGAASADQVAAFGVLGTPRTAEDDVSVAPRDTLDQGLREAAHANLQLARRIGPSDDSARVWLVPGEGQLCVVTDESARVGFQCVPNAAAARGEAVQTRSGGPELTDDSATVAQLLPDGVGVVTISSRSASARTDAPVTRNWIRRTLKSPSSIGFELHGASQGIPLGHLPR